VLPQLLQAPFQATSRLGRLSARIKLLLLWLCLILLLLLLPLLLLLSGRVSGQAGIKAVAGCSWRPAGAALLPLGGRWRCARLLVEAVVGQMAAALAQGLAAGGVRLGRKADQACSRQG
jgi:hypothetical protein